jgi:hypothetical protein
MHEQFRFEDKRNRFEESACKELAVLNWTDKIRAVEGEDRSLTLKIDVPIIKPSNGNLCADCGLQIRHPA